MDLQPMDLPLGDERLLNLFPFCLFNRVSVSVYAVRFGTRDVPVSRLRIRVVNDSAIVNLRAAISRGRSNIAKRRHQRLTGCRSRWRTAVRR